MTNKKYRYVVTNDKCYYPSIMYFETLKEAKKYFKEVDEYDDDGDKIVYTLSKIVDVKNEKEINNFA